MQPSRVRLLLADAPSRTTQTFFIPSEAYSMQFLRSKLCIVCARGFEIMNLDTLLPGTIPDFSQCPRDDPRIQLLANRVERAKPLGMFKNSEAEFLLCYDGELAEWLRVLRSPKLTLTLAAQPSLATLTVLASRFVWTTSSSGKARPIPVSHSKRRITAQPLISCSAYSLLPRALYSGVRQIGRAHV